jgi:hypothetical protein
VVRTKQPKRVQHIPRPNKIGNYNSLFLLQEMRAIQKPILGRSIDRGFQ